MTDPDALGPAEGLLREQIERLDLLASRFRADSELSRLNAAAGRTWQLSEGLAELVGISLRAARLTDGAVDPTVGAAMRKIGYAGDFATMNKDQPDDDLDQRPVPGWRVADLDRAARTICLPEGVALDLGATAKAFCADRAAALVTETLGCGALVSIGGDLSISGIPPAGGWKVGLSEVSSAPADQVSEVVALQSGGLVSSGTSARSWLRGGRAMHHLIDPRTGLPVDSPWRTVTVAAASCVDANIAATAAMVKGAVAPAWLSGLGLPSFLVDATGEVVRVGSWPSEEVG